MSTGRVNYEDVLADQLDYENIRYEREYQFHPERRWRADFYLPDYNLIIEVDGIKYKGYAGHQTGSGFQGDLYKLNHAVLMGLTVLRFTPAMVSGRAREDRKGKPRMEMAIDTIKRYIANRDIERPK